jgi:hypothetical protein
LARTAVLWYQTGMLRFLSAFLLVSLFSPLASQAGETNGPTIPLRLSTQPAAASPVADFMYFVPLISTVPVTSLISPGNTQAVRMTSCKRSNSGKSFTAWCELAVDGNGRQQSLFDIAFTARRHKQQLQDGKAVAHQLRSIDVRGAGVFQIEVKGDVVNEAMTVNEVQLHFNAHGHVSPVWIDLCDIVKGSSDFAPTNEVMARVNALTFERKPGPPVMKVTISSLKDKEAGDSFWQNLKGRIKGATVNMFIPPLGIEKVGNQTMLDFGRALISESQTFTFPKARNFRGSVSSLSN